MVFYREWRRRALITSGMGEENKAIPIKLICYEMSKKRKLLAKILAGSKNITFDEFISLVQAFGFKLSRVNGSHHIFIHSDIPELLNLQNRKGQAIPYQINQFLTLVEKYSLTLED